MLMRPAHAVLATLLLLGSVACAHQTTVASVPTTVGLKSFSPDQLRAELAKRADTARPGDKSNKSAEAAPAANPVLAAASADEIHAELLFQEKSIYGVDDRKDIREVSDASVIANARRTVALIERPNLKRTNGLWHLEAPTLAQRKGVCSTERFASQPTGAFCTGFLVGPSQIATAGHCVPTKADISTFYAVFDYQMIDKDTPRLDFTDDQVYTPTARTAWKLDNTGADFAVVSLDRAVKDRKPVEIRTQGIIQSNASVYVIGCPSGLPMKYAPGATVRDATPPDHFVANLDTFGGNSGSPVFGAGHVVEGILVRGETDYEQVGTCKKPLVCPTTGCRGEDCTRITSVFH